MKMADSMTAIRMTGREILPVTIAMIRKIAIMEMRLTTWKSCEVRLIIS